MRLSEEVIRYLTVKQEVPKTTNTDAQNQSEPVGADVE